MKNLLREAVVFLKEKFSISSFPIFRAFSPDSLILEYCLHELGENMGSRFHRASSNCIISRYLARFLVQLVKRGVCRHHCQQTSVFFGCFSDALPDRWGRTLLKRRYSSGGWSDLQKIFKVAHKSPFTESGLC